LAGHADQPHEPERPAGASRAESDLDEILRLVNLHRVPGEQPEEVSKRDPPETARWTRARERPVDGRPRRVYDVRAARGGRATRGDVAVRLETDVIRSSPQREVEGHQDPPHQHA